MTRKQPSKGACSYCSREMSGRGMGRHLRSCEKRREAIEAASRKRGGSGTFLHLQVRDAARGEYWLHLEAAGSATLDDLDDYLRRIWLECCDHLSMFSVGGWRGEEIPFDAKLGRVFRPGVELTHIYDFGTSSYTLIKAVDERSGKATTKYPIALMARNAPPSASCMECGKAAAYLCMECVIEEDREGTLCDEHAEVHPHDDYGEPLPLVNSPRVGMCGYCGPAEPPYG